MKQNRVSAIIELIIIEGIFFSVLYFMYGSYLGYHTFPSEALGFPNFNNLPIEEFFSFNPNLTNALFITIFNLNSQFFPLFFNLFFFFIAFLIPLGFYYLVKSLGASINVRVISTLFYSINPLTLIFSLGLEYTGIFLFFPLILAFQIKHYKNKHFRDIATSFILIFLMSMFFGVSYLKFIIFIFIAVSIADIFSYGKPGIASNLKHYLLGAILFLVISAPLLAVELGFLHIYYVSSASNSSTLASLTGITRFEFSDSNILTSLYALPYVANQLTSINYESSWYALLYLFLIFFGLISVIKNMDQYRYVNYALFSVLVFLILFQYGVYNDSLIYLYYNYAFLDVYNYPLFFYISQILIYSIFISITLESLLRYVKIKDIKLKTRQIGKPLIYFISIFLVIAIIISSLPVMAYEHSSNPTTSVANEFPSYAFNLSNELKPYSHSRVLILPNNGSSLGYLDTSVNYYNIYGLPYGYQNFVSLFPNATRFLQLGNAFQLNNTNLVSESLQAESINAIVVLHPLSNQQISIQGTSINGGGKNFDRIINSTNVYKIVQFNKNYAIYKFNPYASINNSHSNFFYYYNYLNYQKSINNITTSTLSYQCYPIYIAPDGMNASGYYDFKVEINRNNLTYINENFTNILFAYQNGTFAPAWIENINNNIATIYIKLKGDINRTLDLRVYPETVNEMQTGYLGEAPELSGQGSTVLPPYITYSSVIVGVYGYGYAGNVFTLNFTFNPSYFSNVLNANLTNLAFYSYNGTILDAHLDSYAKDSATVTLSIPSGVQYFMLQRTSFNPYNILYMGFASKKIDLNALNSIIEYNSNQPEFVIGYLPYAVKNFGIYNQYDNGRKVFPYFNSFVKETSYVDAWAFSLPVAGYGFFSDSSWPPSSYLVNGLYNITKGEKATTYSYVYGSNTSSPIYISNVKGSALLGEVNSNLIGFGMNKTLQQHSTDVGFGVNSTEASVFLNYNNSKTYVYNIINSTSIKGFNNYSIYYENGLHFYLNGKTVGYSDYNHNKSILGLSSVYTGQMISLYSFVSNNARFNYTIGEGKIYQAYFNNSQLQNPAYENSNITFTFYGSTGYNSTIQWNINGIKFNGSTVNYAFPKPGKYTITISYDGKIFNYIESIMASPSNVYHVINFTSTGIHFLSVNNSRGAYEWFVNGIQINNNKSALNFNFKQYGTYGIRVFILNSSGNYSVNYIINIYHVTKINPANYLYIVYNSFLPLILILYVTSERFRRFIYIRLRRLRT